MIIVCKGCLPVGSITHGNPWSYAPVQCAACSRVRPHADLFFVDMTVQDFRFERWRSQYVYGPDRARR